MKIQEMRSGNLHLARRREADERESPFLSRASDVSVQPEQPKTSCELDQRLWSVISFERCEAAGLTYEQAAQLQAELDSRGVNGLCIVTNAAARRVRH